MSNFIYQPINEHDEERDVLLVMKTSVKINASAVLNTHRSIPCYFHVKSNDFPIVLTLANTRRNRQTMVNQDNERKIDNDRCKQIRGTHDSNKTKTIYNVKLDDFHDFGVRHTTAYDNKLRVNNN